MFVIIVMKLNEFFDNIKDINDIVESIQDKEIKRKHPLAGGLQGQSALLAAGLFLYSFLHPHNWRTSPHNPLSSLSSLSTLSPQLVHLLNRHHHHHHHYQRQHFDCRTFFFSSFLGFSHVIPDLWSAYCESSLG